MTPVIFRKDEEGVFALDARLNEILRILSSDK